MKHLLIALVRIYQRVAPIRIRGLCMYTPTCSEYSIQCLRKHGAVKGVQLTCSRLRRCNGTHSGGVDLPP